MPDVFSQFTEHANYGVCMVVFPALNTLHGKREALSIERLIAAKKWRSLPEKTLQVRPDAAQVMAANH